MHLFNFSINTKSHSLCPSFLSRHGVLKPWEIDLRDICQRLRCFFACCKGQIVIHITEVDSAEIEDIEENVKKDL